MHIEIREDSVVITGYVNAVERYSKPIKESLHGKIRTFIERIRSGVFKSALQRNDDVKVLLNHDENRELATTKDGTAILEEDNIGLRAEVTIIDKDVIEKAKNNKLVGWSFGFYANSDELGKDGNSETRTVTSLDLLEVSILDDTKSPAYYGTSIEARSENEKVVEYRASTIAEIEEEAKKKHKSVSQKENDNWDKTEKEHEAINIEKEEKKIKLVAEMIADIILEKLKEGADEKKTIPENSAAEEKGNRAFDYSSYEDRLRRLKKI